MVDDIRCCWAGIGGEVELDDAYNGVFWVKDWAFNGGEADCPPEEAN